MPRRSKFGIQGSRLVVASAPSPRQEPWGALERPTCVWLTKGRMAMRAIPLPPPRVAR